MLKIQVRILGYDTVPAAMEPYPRLGLFISTAVTASNLAQHDVFL